MSVQQLPSKRWRAQVYDPRVGTKVSVATLLTPAELAQLGARNGTFAKKQKAVAAAALAGDKLGARGGVLTVAEWRERWLTDPIWERPAKSSNINREERTRRFAATYGDLPLDHVDDAIVAEWFAGGKNRSTAQNLRTMYNDAGRPEAGRLVRINPFSGLRLSRSRGNKDNQPPSVEQMAQLIDLARELTTPSFADYLEFAGLTAMRPGEMDAFAFDEIDHENSEVDVRQQWNAKAGALTTPKYGRHRVSLVCDALDVLARAEGYRSNGVPWVFPTLRGNHYTPSSRNHHWNRVRAAAGLGDMTLYLATRHYCAWRLYVVLGLPKEVVAAQLGHKDGGKLVEELYGHPDTSLRLKAVREAYNAARGPQESPDTPPDLPARSEPENARPSLHVVGDRASSGAAVTNGVQAA